MLLEVKNAILTQNSGTYLIRRFAFSVIALLFLLTFVFILSRAVPGDPAMFAAGLEATAEQIEKVREEYGLNKDYFTQYVMFLKGLSKGNLGRSMYTRRPVAEDLIEKLPASLELTIAAMIFGIIIGVPLAVVAGTKPRSFLDHGSRVLGLIGLSLPVFWYGIILQIIFYGFLGWFSASGRLPIGTIIPNYTGFILVDSLLAGDLKLLGKALNHLILPAFALSQVIIALIVRMLRSNLLDVMGEDYIMTARAKGLSEKVVIFKHAIKNAILPVLTLLGVQIGLIMSGAVLTEAIFSWPGIGSYAYRASMNLDYPVILGVTLMIGGIFLLVNLLVDIIHGLLDPRLRYD